MRITQLQIGDYYHIYNRGVDKRMIFLDRRNYIRFIRSMREFNKVEPVGSLYKLDYLRKKIGKEAELPIGSSASGDDKLVKMICYSLLNNHYHFLLKQERERGIEKYLHRIGTSYTKYFNYKYGRTGALFQGRFKAVHIKTNKNLLRLSAYINANCEIHQIAQAKDWSWSSYLDYMGKRNGTMCYKKVILNQFKDFMEFKEYVDYIIGESKQLKSEIKELSLE